MSERVNTCQPYDNNYQYIMFPAEPYEMIAFKVFSLTFFCHLITERFTFCKYLRIHGSSMSTYILLDIVG